MGSACPATNSGGTANSPVVLPMSTLSTSFASAPSNTSLLRSTRSAPSGVVLRDSSILARQGLSELVLP